MAKRKSKSKVRRRRVGGAKLNPGNTLVRIAIGVGGYLLADKINAPIEKMIGDKVDGKIVAGGEVGVGAFLTLGKGKKTWLKTIPGCLLIGAGAKKAMQEFGIGGIGNPYGRLPVVAGAYGRTPVLAGYSPNQALNGYSPNASLNGRRRVMAGVMPGSGSGMAANGGSNHMN